MQLTASTHLDTLHPRQQIVTTMNRIYYGGMTTFSGGNLSILDANGDMWITPAGYDKGRLHAEDIMCVKADGTIEGIHRPSSEYPFHRAIYERRPDLRAIVHAHPPALISFSLVREIPEVHITPAICAVCGEVGYAPYAMTGSAELGAAIAATFAQGYNVVMLENHGVVTAADTMLTAFQRFETLEYCARTLIKAKTLGVIQTTPNPQSATVPKMPEFTAASHNDDEQKIRQQVVDMVKRAVERQLMLSTSGVVSARIDESIFIITPADYDRYTVQVEDCVLIREGQREAGKFPHESVHLHQQIYDRYPEIVCIISAQPPHVMAYAVTGAHFDTRTIPESYVMLVDIPSLPFATPTSTIAETISTRQPTLLIQNEGLLVVGQSILQAYDRLEVAEFSAKSLLDTHAIGQLQLISDADIAALKAKFNL
jgi:L-fuculose-phosphate aldolase